MNNSQQATRNAVLVVEDAPLVRLGAVDLVEDAGFVVYEADNAEEAIHMLEEHEDIFALFTDIEMPGSMDGLKLAHMVNRRWPPVAILVASGYLKLSRQDMPDDAVFFTKPYAPAEIAKALNAVAPHA